MEAELIEDRTMTELECQTELEWQKIKEDRRELERQKIHRGDRVRASGLRIQLEVFRTWTTFNLQG